MLHTFIPDGLSRRIAVGGLVVGAVLAGIAVAAILMSMLGPSGRLSGASDPTSSPSLSPTATPTATPTAAATMERSPPPSAPAGETSQIAPDTLAVVMVDELNIREAPTSTAKSLGHLAAGDRVFVLDGPEAAGGFTWYRVVLAQERDAQLGCAPTCVSAPGWVAGTTSAHDDWLVSADLTCPKDPDLKSFARLASFERLACYGDQTLTLRGVVWQPCCGYVGPTVYEPSWLSWPSSVAYLTWTKPLTPGGLMLRFDPADNLPRPKYADIVRVTGHLDDPAAGACTVRVDESALYEDPTLTVDPDALAFAPISCRTEFVVETIDILGNTGETCGC